MPIKIPLDFPYKISDKLLEVKVEELALDLVKTKHANLTYKYSSTVQAGLKGIANPSNAKSFKFEKRTTIGINGQYCCYFI